jgi:hypothetical protein
MDDVNLWWVAIQKQILDPDVHEFVHPGTGLEQRLDHQPVFAPAPVGGLNQAFDFALSGRPFGRDAIAPYFAEISAFARLRPC